MHCVWHCCNRELVGRQQRFCSAACKNSYHVDARRKKLKEMAVEHKGGKCELCGYDRCIQALTFHHIDPTQKDFTISASGHTRSWNKLRRELNKCIMLCANCHAEVHAGVVSRYADKAEMLPSSIPPFPYDAE